VPSIVIPAHNEQAVIGRTLSALLADARGGEFEVVVVPNGCTDRTGDAARVFEPAVTVVEVERASKIAALNAGDQHVTSFPRLYLDADIALPTAVARALASALDVPEPRLALPTEEFDYTGCSWLVRTYLKTFALLSRDRDDAGGSGVYGLNAAARQRFSSFPELTGDDLFVDRLFHGEERLRVPDVVTVAPPRHLRALFAVRTRVYTGNLEYVASREHPLATRAQSNREAFLRLARRPSAWMGLAVYLTISAAAKVAARRRSGRQGEQRQWLRDESSRRPPWGPFEEQAK
jgi:glycosyltransferase involved in cell wall biosynthesis